MKSYNSIISDKKPTVVRPTSPHPPTRLSEFNKKHKTTYEPICAGKYESEQERTRREFLVFPILSLN